ncbi:MAG TPA: SMP-30/gluconolactonase/LRE family protein [Steroidobacteraceae bacterium]|nr:SMP-30/gluconolactonase/LRE family protein [Steroidobacteraceae bacterium]
MKTLRAAICLVAACIALPVQAARVEVLNDDVHFPEGPIWHAGKLYYVEYDRNTITVWDGRSNRIFASQKGCGPSAVFVTRSGEFIATCYDNGTIGRWSADGKSLPAYDHDRDGNRFVGPNDFAPDHLGGIYFTGSGHPGTAVDGQVFYIAADGVITLAASDLNAANGVVVSRDGKTLYVIETEENRLLRFTIGPAGHLSDRRVFLNLDELTHHVGHIYPDGVKMDSQGHLYIGQNPRDPHAPLAGTIFVVDDKGHLLRSIALPSPGVPNMALSPDEKTLYVTALDQLDKPPFKGKIYAVPNE